jgi:hypothetical protein
MNKQLKAEVESVLQRALIGHERAIVAHFIARGMMNPIDIARALLTRHLDNNASRAKAIDEERRDIERQLRMVNVAADWTLIEGGAA